MDELSQEATAKWEYTPGKIWLILTEGTEDLDEAIDVEAGLKKLPSPQRTFLNLLIHGHTGVYALREAGLRGNQTRLKREVLMQLAGIINQGVNTNANNHEQ